MTDFQPGYEKREEMRKQIVAIKSQWAKETVPHEILHKLTELEEMLAGEQAGEVEQAGYSAQVSIYPLRTPNLSHGIQLALDVFKEYGLEVNPGSMSTLLIGSEKTLWQALRRAFQAVAAQGETVMIVTFSNACPLPHH